MAAWGAPADVLARMEPEDDEVEVLTQNLTTVDLFGYLQPTIAVGLGGASPIGFSSQEIHAGMLIRGVPRRKWREVSAGIAVMWRVFQG